MKRAFLNFHQLHAVDDKAKARLKHQTLLQEYVELQKEFVSNKRKLQITKQKRETLLAEVLFLRRRHRFLLKVQSPKLELEKCLFQSKNSDIERNKLEREVNDSASEAPLRNPSPVLISNWNLIVEEEKGGKEHVVRKVLDIRKNTKCYSIVDKRLGKKKISLQDPATLKV